MGKGFIAAAAIAGAGIAYYLYTRRRKPQPLLEPRHPLLPSLPVLGLGTGGVPPSEISKPTVESIVAALTNGVQLIDVAENYGEASLGEGLRQAGFLADAAFTLCKCDLAPPSLEAPEKRVRRQVMRTLKHVGRSKLDAVVIHWPICLAPVKSYAEHAEARKGCWRGLEALVDEGKIGYIGVSNYTVDLLDELLSYARIQPSINEIEFSPACCQTILVASCYERGIVPIGYSPYGVCWMAGCMGPFYEVKWGVTVLLEDETVKAIAAEVKATPAQVLLRHSLQHGVVCIPKSSKPSRVVESAGVFDVSLSAAQMSRLDALTDWRRGTKAAVEAHLKIIASKPYYWDPEISRVHLGRPWSWRPA